MSKKQCFFVCFSIILMFWCSFPSEASESKITVTGVEDTKQDAEEIDMSRVEQAKDSVVQIVLQYVGEDGNKYLLKSGSGFLISDSVILTNYQNVTLTDAEKELASEFIREQTGKNVDFNSSEGGQAAYQIGVAVYRDVVFTATLNTYSSKEMDLAILNISDSINRSKATLGNSEELENGTELYAIGYKEVSVMSTGETELLSQEDCKETAGTLSKIVKESQIKYLSHTIQVHKGNTGGPVVDINGNVVGMMTYRESENETADSFRALSINEIKGLLDSCEIAYQEAGLFSDVENLYEEEEVVEKEKPDVDTNLLDNYIVNFNMLEQSNYTPESFAALQTALQKAREIKNDKEVTQEEIDDAVIQLEIAKGGLVLASKTNWPFIIAMVILAVAVIAGFIIYILYLKGFIGHKGEKESLQTLQEITNRSRANLNGQSASLQGVGAVNNGLNIAARKGPSRQLQNRGDGRNNGTTVLVNNGVSQSQDNNTTVLGVMSNTRITAYLTRIRTSEKINIDRNEFVIGKGASESNYCIRDNSTISRTHAKIINTGSAYYLVDLHSTNSTYLNGKLLHPEEEVELLNGSVLRLSDEEFVFNLS